MNAKPGAYAAGWDDQSPNLAHTWPVAALSDPGEPDHEIHGLTCWCEPLLFRLCTQCDGQGNADDGSYCWVCDEGLIEVGRDEILPGDRILVVHHYIPEGVEIERL
jgi:hypothetical protein